MALHPGSRRYAVLLMVMLVPAFATALAAADSPVGKVLIKDDFEADAVGAPPPRWTVFVDDGNSAVVTDKPALGKRSLKLTRSGGTVWKPMVSGAVSGEAESALRLDFDWYLPALFDSDADGLSVVLRGDGNRAIVTVTIGGPGGVAVRQKDWLPLLFPTQPGVWGHLTILADPIARGGHGACDVIVTQNTEKMTYANIAFAPDGHDQFPRVYWYSPCFHLGAGKPGAPAEAYIDNVEMTVIRGRD